MAYSIVPISEQYFSGLYDAFDSVAREKKYLAFLQAPPREESYSFFRGIAEHGHCLLLALCGDAVAGWCDIVPVAGDARAHVGVLGMGVVSGHRRKGVGARLLDAAIANAAAKGLTRIELAVRIDNLAAVALYRRFGFEIEGIRRHSLRVEGEYHDSYAMALLP